MHVLFEEYAGPQRTGGIEAATQGLIHALTKEGVVVTRRFADAPDRPSAIPDCVHVHGIWSPILALRFLRWRRQGIPCVVTAHGMLAPWALAHKFLKKRVVWLIYQKAILNRAAVLHVTSEREAQDLRNLGLKPRIEIIPWGIEMLREDKALNSKHEILNGRKVEESQGAARQHIGQQTTDNGQRTTDNRQLIRTALFVGRIYPVKGLPMLVEAWAKVRPQGWKMKIVGPDEAGHLAEVKQLVHKAGLESYFEFTGSLEGLALRRAYDEADLFILPSYTENFGMVVAEALAHGLPVIATKGSPWSAMLDHGCGWWTEISSDGIADALLAATPLNPPELHLMGIRGRNWIEQDFTWNQCANRMAALYRSL